MFQKLHPFNYQSQRLSVWVFRVPPGFVSDKMRLLVLLHQVERQIILINGIQQRLLLLSRQLAKTQQYIQFQLRMRMAVLQLLKLFRWMSSGIVCFRAGDDSICGTFSKSFCKSSWGNGGPYNYVWSNGAGTNLFRLVLLWARYTVTVSDNCGTPPVVLLYQSQ